MLFGLRIQESAKRCLDASLGAFPFLFSKETGLCTGGCPQKPVILRAIGEGVRWLCVFVIPTAANFPSVKPAIHRLTRLQKMMQ